MVCCFPYYSPSVLQKLRHLSSHLSASSTRSRFRKKDGNSLLKFSFLKLKKNFFEYSCIVYNVMLVSAVQHRDSTTLSLCYDPHKYSSHLSPHNPTTVSLTILPWLTPLLLTHITHAPNTLLCGNHQFVPFL